MFGKNFFRHIAAAFLGSILLLSFVSASFAKDKGARGKSLLTVYSNTAPITINTASGLTAPTTATLYPSTINVSGMTGTITKVEVTLKGLSHTNFSNVDMLLVSPSGAKYIFLSDAGSSLIIDDYVYTFSDTAASTVGVSPFPFPGTYLPTNIAGGTDTFPAPAPAAPYNSPPGATFASTFNGSDPNGTWSLYVVDDAINEPGSLNSGWSLNITTDGAPQTFANSAYIGINDILTPATPYGSTINVSGASGVISNLKVTLTGYSHTASGDVDILLVSPNGKGLILMSDVFGAASSTNLTFDDAASGNVSFPFFSGAYKPTDITVESLDTFPSPAPFRPYLRSGSNQLSNFNGFSPNGDWRLFVVDDAQSNAGSISGGWSLDITTIPTPPPTPATCLSPNFTPTSFPVGVNPTNIAIADFNNDTKADLAVTNQVSNDVSILLGNGDGTFAAQTTVTAATTPYAIVAGKFNADSNFDLAVVNSGSNNVSILLGNGTGGFSAPTNFVVGPSPISVAVGDFNNDTKQDLAVANFGSFFFGSVSILLGNGTGGFTAGNTIRAGTQPSYVAVTNFNGDANQDIIVANFGSDSISTYFGLGNGTFQLNQNILTYAGPVGLEVSDFIGADGFPDIAIAPFNFDKIMVCSGSSSGAFVNCNGSFQVGAENPISITAADYALTGTNNLAIAMSGSSIVRILTLGNNISVGQNPNAIETADFNGDSRPDLVTVNSGTNDVSVLINSCQTAKGNLFDYNNDRRTDFSVFRPREIAWYVNSLTPAGATKNFGRPTDIIVPEDYDGDRFTDFAVYRPDSGLWFIIDRNSKPIYFQQFGIAGDIPAPGDFDGDGKADLAVWRPSDTNWYIRRSIDNSMMTMQFGLSTDKPVVNDYDGDGKADIAVYRPSTGDWYIFRSSDSQVYIMHFGIAEDKTVSGDYDGDGKADLAVWRPSTGVWYVLRSSDGDYRAVAWGLNGDFPVVGDYEGDGKFDYAIWRPSEGKWYVLKSSDSGSLVFNWGTTGDFPLPSAFVR